MTDPTKPDDPDSIADILFRENDGDQPGPKGEVRPNPEWAVLIEKGLEEVTPEPPGEQTQRILVPIDSPRGKMIRQQAIRQQAGMIYERVRTGIVHAAKAFGTWAANQIAYGFDTDIETSDDEQRAPTDPQFGVATPKNYAPSNRTPNPQLLTILRTPQTTDNRQPAADLDRLVGAISLRGRQKLEPEDEKQIRVHNEDSIYFNAAMQVYAVADGLGGIGHNGGQYASAEAVKAAERIARRMEDTARDFFDTEKGGATLKQVIEHEVRTVNKRIYELRKDPAHPERQGMNSTLSLAVIAGGHLFTVNVGDSRIYEVAFSEANRIPEPANGWYGRLGLIPRQITEDDSLIQKIQDMADEEFAEMIMKLERNGREYQGVHVDEIRAMRRGFASNLEREMNRHHSKMTRALGMADEQFSVKCDVKPLEGDVLLMSDGAAFLAPADLMEALGNVEWHYTKGTRSVEMRYAFSPQRAAELIAKSANEPFYEDSGGVGYSAFAEFKRIKRKEYITGNNLMNLPQIEKELDKPFSTITPEELETWARRNNPASLLSESGRVDYENEWLKEFNQRFAGKDDVSVIYVRARPAVPADIRQKLHWLGNKRLTPVYGSELMNGFSRTEIRMRNAEEDADYMRALFGRLRTDPSLYEALDAEIAQMKKEFGEFRAEVERTTMQAVEAQERERRAAAKDDAAYRREKEGRLRAISSVLGALTDTKSGFADIDRLTRSNFRADDALFGMFMKILKERKQGIDALNFFDEFKKAVYIPTRDAGVLYRTKAGIAEGALVDAVAIVQGLKQRSDEQTGKIKDLEKRMDDENKEHRGFQNALFVALTTNIGQEDIREMAQTYRTAGRRAYADVLDAAAGFVGAYIERIEAAQKAEAAKNAAERRYDDLETRARGEREGLTRERETARDEAKQVGTRLKEYIETYGAVIGALNNVARYLASPPEDGAIVDLGVETLNETAKAYKGEDKDRNLYKLLIAMADVMEGVGRQRVKEERTDVQPVDTVLPTIPEQYREAYQTGMHAFAEGRLQEARTVLETFRQTDVAPGLYLLGTVVAQLYPDNMGAQKFSRHLVGKARTIDEEIEMKMEPITTQGE